MGEHGGRIEALVTSASLPVMAFSYSVVLNDPSNLGGTATDAALAADVGAALSSWSKYVTGIGTLVVELDVTNTTVGRADGSFSAAQPDGTLANGATLIQSSAAYELATGTHVSGSTSDITIEVDPTYLKSLYINPNPAAGDVPPANESDAISVFRHEIGHGLGQSGYYGSGGTLDYGGQYETAFDTWVRVLADGSQVFTGPTAEAVYGGPIPLTTSVADEHTYHFANATTDPLGTDLMNGVAFPSGVVNISDIDLAVLLDSGAPITSFVDRAIPNAISYIGANGLPAALVLASAADAARIDAVLAAQAAGATPITAGGVVQLSAGATGAVDAASAAVTVAGSGAAGQLIAAGDGAFAFAAFGSGTVAAGGGADQVFVTGSAGPWSISLGGGNDTVLAAAGADTVQTGSGATLVFLGSGASSVVSAGADTIVGGAGASTIALSKGLAFAGSGGLTVSGGAGVSTVAGLSGRVSVLGGAGGGAFFGGAAGGNALVAGSGSATLLGGGAGDTLAGGGAAADVLAAGGGAETLTGAGTTGANTFFAGSGPDLLVGGGGANAFVAGTGNDTVYGGGGLNLFVVEAGRAGGTDVIANFAAGSDFLDLIGYGAGAGAAALAGSTISGGSTLLSLSDGTHIVLAGFTGLTSTAFST